MIWVSLPVRPHDGICIIFFSGSTSYDSILLTHLNLNVYSYTISYMFSCMEYEKRKFPSQQIKYSSFRVLILMNIITNN